MLRCWTGVVAAVVVVGCGASAPAPEAAPPADALITVTSAREVDDVVARIGDACTAHGFGVLGVRDMQATLQKKGLAIPRATKVMDVCSPPHAHKALTTKQAVAAVLPCRIAVFAGADGRTHCVCVKPARLFAFFDSGECGEIASEVDMHLRQILGAAAE